MGRGTFAVLGTEIFHDDMYGKYNAVAGILF